MLDCYGRPGSAFRSHVAGRNDICFNCKAAAAENLFRTCCHHWHALQAINGFPQAEIEDPTHEKTPFTGPAKRFFADGAAWDAEPVPGPAVPLSEQKLLQVAVVGVPNAGKSSMVNALTGSKVRTALPQNSAHQPGARTHSPRVHAAQKLT